MSYHDPNRARQRARIRADQALVKAYTRPPIFGVLLLALCAVAALPVFLGIMLWKKRKLSRSRVDFAMASIERGATDHQEMALKWIEAQAQPDKHVRSLSKHQDAFKKIVERQSATDSSYSGTI